MKITEHIYNELKSRLEQGFYPEGSKFPSESTLADEFSANKMTVNKIVSMLAEQKYLVRGVRGAGTRVAAVNARHRGTLAFLSPLTPYTIRILRGVYAEAMRHNFSVIVESPPLPDLARRMQMLQTSGVKGVISATYGTPALPNDMILFCIDSYPDSTASPGKVHFINSDNFSGGKQMMTEIMRRGHREILVFSHERFSRRTDAPKTPRVTGFHQIMEANGITDFEERTFYSAYDSVDDTKYFLETYLKRYPRTTLIAADSDGSAAMLHTMALKLGIDCPGKIALTGFGDVSPLPIANVNQNPERQGELAARYLIDYTLNGTDNAPFSESVETSLTAIEQIPIILKN